MFCREGGVATCSSDGQILPVVPCPDGTVCVSSSCVDPCDALALGSTYEGCSFRGTAPPALLSGHGGPRIPELGFGFHNPESGPSTVTISGGTLPAPESVTIAASSSAFVSVPLIGGVYDRAVYGVSATVLARDTASYRIQASSPVVAYQFSPEFGVVLDEARFLMKADATVLFPTHAWGLEYMVATMPPACRSTPCGPDEMTFAQITADTDGTTVDVDVTATVEASVEGVVTSTEVTEEPVLSIPMGSSTRFTLDAGDVLQIVSAGDLTGTKIAANQPVQLLSGNIGIHLPDRFTPLGDGHMHEAILPLPSWGRDYVVAPAPHPTRDEALDTSLRVVAGNAGAMVTFDPPISAPVTLAPRAHVDLPLTAPCRITATTPILVLGGSSPSDLPTGDSLDQVYGAASMVAYPPFEQWRSDYGFSVPIEFDYAHAIVIHPAAATVTIDGTPTAGGTPIGGTGLVVETVAVDRSTPSHRATSGEGFVILVYGQAAGSSYWYAAGLDAEVLF